ncbi:hypothetical protein [Burkholderia sp. AU18528]|uniref:hypothetical protein n=1 Tax=Burkholderia sp. AU18528 TaxID=2015350 RepID=UPI0015D4D5E0
MIGPPQFCQHPLAQGCEWTVKDRQTKSCSGVCHVDAAAIGAQTADCRSNACELVRLDSCVLDEQVGEIARETRRRIEIGDADLQPALGPVVFERDETRPHRLRMTACGAFGQHATFASIIRQAVSKLLSRMRLRSTSPATMPTSIKPACAARTMSGLTRSCMSIVTCG